MSVEDALEDAGDEERADEGGAHEHLGPLRRRWKLVERSAGALAARRDGAGPAGRARGGGAGHRLVGPLAGLVGLLVHGLGAFALFLRLALLLLLLLLGVLGGLLRLGGLLLGAAGVRVGQVLPQFLPAGHRACAVFRAHSGGSSPKALCQIMAASLDVATDARAPSPASRPAQSSRLTISLSVMGAESKS